MAEPADIRAARVEAIAKAIAPSAWRAPDSRARAYNRTHARNRAAEVLAAVEDPQGDFQNPAAVEQPMCSDVFAAMGISVRVRGCLTRAKIKVLGDLIALAPAELLKIRGLGDVGLQEIEILLKSHKLALAPRQIGG